MNYPIAVLTLKRGSLTHGHADRSKEGLWMIELGQPRGKLLHDMSNCCHDSISSQVIAPSMWLLYRQVSIAGVVLVTVSELTLNTGGFFTGHAYCCGTGIEQQGFDCEG